MIDSRWTCGQMTCAKSSCATLQLEMTAQVYHQILQLQSVYSVCNCVHDGACEQSGLLDRVQGSFFFCF